MYTFLMHNVFCVCFSAVLGWPELPALPTPHHQDTELVTAHIHLGTHLSRRQSSSVKQPRPLALLETKLLHKSPGLVTRLAHFWRQLPEVVRRRAMQRKTAVTAYMRSKQLLLFAFELKKSKALSGAWKDTTVTLFEDHVLVWYAWTTLTKVPYCHCSRSHLCSPVRPKIIWRSNL